MLRSILWWKCGPLRLSHKHTPGTWAEPYARMKEYEETQQTGKGEVSVQICSVPKVWLPGPCNSANNTTCVQSLDAKIFWSPLSILWGSFGASTIKRYPHSHGSQAPWLHPANKGWCPLMNYECPTTNCNTTALSMPKEQRGCSLAKPPETYL